VSALWFLLTRTFRNSLLKRIRRLKDVRYLISSAVFFGYFALVCGGGFAAAVLSDDGKSRQAPVSVGGLAVVLGLMILSVTSTWVWPERNQLIFSPAEIQFLFPAPLSRVALVRLKIVKAQLPLLFTALFGTWATRNTAGVHYLFVFVSLWLAFNASFLHRLGAALTLVPEGSGVRRKLPLVLGRTAVALLLLSLVVSFRARSVEAWSISFSSEDLVAWSQRAPACYAIYPFKLILRPALASDFATFAAALPGSLAVVGILYVWVVRSDAAFEEAAVVASQRFFARVAAIRRTGRLVDDRTKADPAPISLAWSGRPMPALVWKNFLIYTRQPLGRIFALSAALAAAAVAFAQWGEAPLDALVGERDAVGTTLAILLGSTAGFFTLAGTDMYRFDLRTTLGSPDILKAIPLGGRTLFLGEVLAPVIVLAATQAYLLLLAAIFASGISQLAATPVQLGCAWLAAAVVFPPFDLLLFVVANGVAVSFPAWVPVGPEANRPGAEAGGMRMILALVRMVALAVGVVPAALVGVSVAAVGSYAFGAWAPLAWPLGSVVAGAIVLAEALALVHVLGGMLDRFDPAVELR
jgi:hypothetical protein